VTRIIAGCSYTEKRPTDGRRAIPQDPGIRLREIGESVGITERAAHRIVTELAASGYISRTRDGRRSHYKIQSNMPLPDSLARGKRVSHLLTVLATQPQSRSSMQKSVASRAPRKLQAG
jgi:hypothetical protein